MWQIVPRRAIGRQILAATVVATALTSAGTAMAHDGHSDRLNLKIFGPELGFTFPVNRKAKNFHWADLIKAGDTGLGTITLGQGEVLGVDGTFYIATPENPKPRLVTDEMTPSGAVITFTAQKSFRIDGPVDLAALQHALDAQFVNTDTFVYMFKAHATLSFVEYQLAGPRPNRRIIDAIMTGDSQEAVTIGTPKFTARNLKATLVGIRSPLYLNRVLEIPYHIHFISDDKSVLGHITAVEARDLAIDWARTEAISIRYWDTE